MKGLLLAAMLCGPINFDEYPEVEDLQRFPSLTITMDAKKFNDSYMEYMRVRRDQEPHREKQIDMQLNYLMWSSRCWGQLWQAHTEFHGMERQQEALYDLRLLLGPELYYAGTMPASVPYWLFEEVPLSKTIQGWSKDEVPMEEIP